MVYLGIKKVFLFSTIKSKAGISIWDKLVALTKLNLCNFPPVQENSRIRLTTGATIIRVIPTHRSRFTLCWKCFHHLSKLYACNLSYRIFWAAYHNNLLLCKNFGNYVLFRKENEEGFQDIWKRNVAENFVLEALLRLEFSKSAKRTSPVLTRKQDKKRQRIRSLKVKNHENCKL